MKKSKYTQAGVDFEKEHDVVDIMTKIGAETLKNVEDLEKIGITFPEQESDFSGSFQLDLETLINNGVKKIIQSGGVDGPGSKPIVHQLYDGNSDIKLAATAIDSIAMGVNDVICSGARPFVILEYHAWNDVNLDVARQMAKGKIIAAELSKAAIIGGENASLSAMITGAVPEKAYDMCNMVLGLITDKKLIKKQLGKGRVSVGDYIIGLSSSGVHCNGITLGWKTAINFNEDKYVGSFIINEKVEELGESVAEALLTPTIIYVDPVLKVLKEYGNNVKAIANITGEGVHNMERILPKGTGLNLDYSSKEIHPIFKWIQENGKVSMEEMYEDYNMGTGMIMVVDKSSAKGIIKKLNKLGDKQNLDYQRFFAYKLGEVVEKEGIELVAYDKTRIKY